MSHDPLLYEKTLHLEFNPERVFAALSDPDELRIWFAEELEVTPRLHGCFSFWGRFTLWSEATVDGGQTITAFQAPRILAFTWEMEDLVSEVRFDVHGNERHCHLRLRHIITEGEVDPQVREMFADFWRLMLLNLGWYLETGGPMMRLDYTDVAGDVLIELELAAPSPQVFQSLTLPARMDAWLSRQAKVELRVGGMVDFGWSEAEDGETLPAGPTVITEITQDRLIAYDWRWPGEKGKTQVRWELEPLSPGSLVRLRHEGFAEDRDSTDYKQGWAGFLCLLKIYLERGQRWE